MNLLRKKEEKGKMRKFIMALLILAMTVCGVVGIAACGEKEKPDESQNQGQVQPNKDKEEDKDKDKDSETQKPSTGEENKPSSGEVTPGDKEDEGNKGDEGEVNPPHNPEDNPGSQTKPDEGKEDDPTTPENPGEKDPEEGNPDEPQGDDPSAGEPEKPNPDEDKPGKDEPKPEEPGKDEPKPEEKPAGHEHVWKYEAYGDNLNGRQHIQVCTICDTRGTAEKCSFNNGSRVVAPTCTEDGYTSYVCSVCSIEFKSYTIDRLGQHKDKAKGHTYGSWTQVSGKEEHTHTCSTCGYVETKSCTFEGECKDATCEQPAVDTRVCTECKGKPMLLNTAQKLGHDFEYTKDDNSKTMHHVRCKRACCSGKSFDDEACKFEKVSETNGDCTSVGTTTYRCSDCGKEKVEKKTGSLGHVYTTSNFCDKCHQDGLKSNVGNMEGGSGARMQTRKIIYTAELKEVEIIIIGSNISGIDNGAFKDFKKLKKIFIPSLSAMGETAFEGTDSLEAIYYADTESHWKGMFVNGVFGTRLDSTIKFPEKVHMEYQKTEAEARQDWGIDTTSSASTVIALPAGDRKIYA